MVSAEKIKLLRHQYGWSQEQLATISGVSSRTIQRIEKTGDCSLESKMAIAAAFNIPATNLTDGEHTEAFVHQGTFSNAILWMVFALVVVGCWLLSGINVQVLINQEMMFFLAIFWLLLTARVQGVRHVMNTLKLAVGLGPKIQLHQSVAFLNQQIIFTYCAALFAFVLVAVQMLYLQQEFDVWGMRVVANLFVTVLYASFWSEFILRPIKIQLSNQIAHQSLPSAV